MPIGIYEHKNLSQEQKHKISNSLKGRIPWNKGKNISAETKRKISLSTKGRKIIALETRNKISKAHIGKKKPWASLNGFKKLNKPWNYGKQLSEQTKEKSSISHKKYYEKIGKADIKRYHHIKDREYLKWRTEVFIRDNFACQICNRVGGTMNAHHIKEWSKYTEFRYVPDNGITLCNDCHKEIHKKHENNL